MSYDETALDTRFAAAYLGYSPATLRLWRRKGCGPRYQYIGRFVEYLKQDLDTWTSGQDVVLLRRATRRVIRSRNGRSARPATSVQQPSQVLNTA